MSIPFDRQPIAALERKARVRVLWLICAFGAMAFLLTWLCGEVEKDIQKKAVGNMDWHGISEERP